MGPMVGNFWQAVYNNVPTSDVPVSFARIGGQKAGGTDQGAPGELVWLVVHHASTEPS